MNREEKIKTTTTNNVLSREGTEKITWWAILFILTVMLMPHIMLLHNALPFQFLDKSLWLALFLVLTCVCSANALIKINKNEFLYFVLLSSALLITVSVIRSDLYEINIIKELLVSRSLILIPLMLAAAFYYTQDSRTTKAIVWIIILTGFSQALIGIIHKYVFPEIVTGTFASYQGKFFYVDSIRGPAFYSRESGTFGNPSQYADLICLSACLFAWSKPKIKEIPNILNTFLQLLFYVILFLGLMPSLCRLPIVFTFIFFVLFFLEAGLVANFKKLIIPAIVLGLGIVYLIFLQYPQLIERFLSIGAYGRAQKNELIFNYMTSSWQYFFVGITQELKTSLRTFENLGFGDNSYLQLIISCGFPVALTWFSSLILFLKSELKFEFSLLKLCFLLYIIINFYIGDNIYADGWSMFIFLVMVIFFKKDHPISPKA